MRSVGTVALWLFATIGATALAWQAVGKVGVAASGDAVGTVVASVGAQSSRSNGDTSLTSPVDTTKGTAQMSTTTAADTPVTSTTVTTTQSTNTQSTVSTAGTPSTAGGSTTSASPSQTTVPSTSAPATTTTTPPTPTTQSPAASSTQTFTLTGGSVTVSFSASAVTVILAEPSNGFTTKEVKQENPTQVLVRFTSKTHESRLRAWWLAGPQTEIRD